MVNIDKKRKTKVEKMDIIMNSRNDMVQLFLDFIRPLKAFYSPKRAFLHVGNTGAHYGEKSARMEGWARVLWGLLHRNMAIIEMDTTSIDILINDFFIKCYFFIDD